jgi:hypothetical protein
MFLYPVALVDGGGGEPASGIGRADPRPLSLAQAEARKNFGRDLR